MSNDRQKMLDRRYHEKMKNDPHYREMRRKAQKAWYDRNPDRKKMEKLNWYENNKHRISAARTQMRQRYRDMLFEALGGAKCIKCGFSDRRALCFDHINGDGTKKMHHEEMKDHHNFVKYARNPELARKTFQVLCANCNAIKRMTRYKSPLKNLVS
jgi:hypothetical protein